MKLCPQCGQSLTRSDPEEKKSYAPKPEAQPKKSNWFERHPGPSLVLVIACAPFVLWGIAVALIMLASLLPAGIDEAAARGVITAMPLAYIAAIVTMVRWYRQQRRQTRSPTDYAKAVGQRLESADAYHKRADAGVELGEYAQAIADYSKAIDFDPRHSLSYFNRAYAYGEIGDYDKAITDYTKVIELDPGDAQAFYNRGLDYQNKGEMGKAASDMDKCIKLSTDPQLTEDAQQALNEIKSADKRAK